MKKINLTNKQKRIIELMKNGYGLWSFLGIRAANATYVLQEGKRGHGGKSENVDGRSAEGLLKRGIIKVSRQVYSDIDYVLSPEYEER